jgi:hypothetical protein
MLRGKPVQQGDPAAWTIGNDTYAFRVIAGPAPGLDDRGRFGSVITGLVQRRNRAGEPFTAIQKVLDRYVLEPVKGLDAELIFGTKDAPLSLDEALDAHEGRSDEFRAEQMSASVVVTE